MTNQAIPYSWNKKQSFNLPCDSLDLFISIILGKIIELDISNSTISVQKDTFVAGSSDAGVGYTTTSAY